MNLVLSRSIRTIKQTLPSSIPRSRSLLLPKSQKLPLLFFNQMLTNFSKHSIHIFPSFRRSFVQQQAFLLRKGFHFGRVERFLLDIHFVKQQDKGSARVAVFFDFVHPVALDVLETVDIALVGHNEHCVSLLVVSMRNCPKSLLSCCVPLFVFSDELTIWSLTILSSTFNNLNFFNFFHEFETYEIDSDCVVVLLFEDVVCKSDN